MAILVTRYDMGEMLRFNPGQFGISSIRDRLEDLGIAAKLPSLPVDDCHDDNSLDKASESACSIYSKCRWIKFMFAHATGIAFYMHTLIRRVVHGPIHCSMSTSIPNSNYYYQFVIS